MNDDFDTAYQRAVDTGWGSVKELARMMWDAKAQPLQVPEGWKLVPVEPTPEMIDAMVVAASCDFPHSDALDSYTAMLAAAPAPVVEQAEPAPAQDEREAATDAAYAAVVDGGWSSVKEMGVKMFQAGAEWARASRPVVINAGDLRALIAGRPADGLVEAPKAFMSAEDGDKWLAEYNKAEAALAAHRAGGAK